MNTRLTRFVSKGVEFEFASNDNAQPSKNYYTVLIGANGSGKTRLLKQVVLALTQGIVNNKDRVEVLESEGGNIYKYVYDNQKIHVSKNGKKLINHPYTKHVITFTASITDKLPSRPQHRYCTYSYLGPIDRRDTLSLSCYNSSSLKEFLDCLNWDNLISYIEGIQYTFEFLQFQAKVCINFKLLGSSLSKLKDAETQKRDFKRHIKECETRYQISDEEIDTLSEFYFNKLKWLKKCGRSNVSVALDFGDKDSQQKRIKRSLYEYTMYSRLQSLQLLDNPKFSLFTSSGNEFSCTNLSSGESAIITSMLRLIPIVKPGSIVIIDEPELSLHPSWQYGYVELLDSVLGVNSGCHVFMATHSHCIISDLPTDRSEVLQISQVEKNMQWKRFNNTESLSAEEILLDIFELPTTRNHYLSSRLERVLYLAGQGHTDTPEFFELIKQINRVKSHLRSTDPLKDVIDALSGVSHNG